MLRLIHTSDWHLGHELYGHDRSADHRAFLDQLRSIVKREQPDALIVSGDIYHTAAPSNATMTLFHSALTDIHRAYPPMHIIVTAGNHDSPSRIEVSSAVWRELGAHMIGTIARDNEGVPDIDAHIIDLMGPDGDLRGIAVALPHIYPGAYPATGTPPPDRDRRQQVFLEAIDAALARRRKGRDIPVVMSAHMAVTGCDTSAHDERGGIEYVPLESIPVDFDYLALGHIHCNQRFRRGNALAAYCGTPVAVSFDERPIHSVNLVEIDAHGSTPRITPIEIAQSCPLVTIPDNNKAMSFEEALATLGNWDTDAYLRVSVATEDVAPPHALERGAAAAAAGCGRFCTFRWVRPERDIQDQTTAPRDIEEFKALTPAEVARRYYADRTGRQMPDDLGEMFEEILKDIQTHETD